MEKYIQRIQKTATCWNWLGCLKKKTGYGVIRMKRKEFHIHRIIYSFYKGEIPKGLQIDHLCRNRKCVNPEHLEAVTIKENVMRGESIHAKNARKTHCLNGHELTGWNLIARERNYYTKGKLVHTGMGRTCRICRNVSKLASYHKNKIPFAKARGKSVFQRTPVKV